MVETIWDYLYFYQSYTNDSWRRMRPYDYGAILIVVGLIGWWLMQFKKR
jgi:hypothetical protein